MILNQTEASGRDQPDKKFMLTRNKETLCWDFKGEDSSDFSEPPEPVLEAIGSIINEDNPSWEGTATELIEKLELDIKPNALSLKLNVNAGKLYNQYFVQYSSKRTHKAKIIQLRYDTKHPVVVAPEVIKDDASAENKTSDGVPVLRSEITINSNTVDDIAQEDYETTAYQLMIENALA